MKQNKNKKKKTQLPKPSQSFERAVKALVNTSPISNKEIVKRSKKMQDEQSL